MQFHAVLEAITDEQGDEIGRKLVAVFYDPRYAQRMAVIIGSGAEARVIDVDAYAMEMARGLKPYSIGFYEGRSSAHVLHPPTYVWAPEAYVIERANDRGLIARVFVWARTEENAIRLARIYAGVEEPKPPRPTSAYHEANLQ